jgi:hypothetical protein
MWRAFAMPMLTVLVVDSARAQEWEAIPMVWGYDPDVSMDPQGNAHLIFTRYTGEVEYVKYHAASSAWGDTVRIPHSMNLWEQFGRPKVDVGPNGRPHVVWGEWGLACLMYARATTSSPQTAQDWNVSFIDVGWCAWPDVAVDDQNNPHFAFERVDGSGWKVVYRDPSGNEVDVDSWSSGAYRPNEPAIEWSGGVVHYAWQKNYGDHGRIYYANSTDWSEKELMTPGVPTDWAPGQPHVAVSPLTGKAGVVFFYDDWTEWAATGYGYHKGVYYSESGGPYMVQLWSCDAQILDDMWLDDWYPMVDFDSSENRYVVWTVHENAAPPPYYNKTYYRLSDQPVVQLQSGGGIAVGGGPTGAMMVRAVPNGGALHWCHFSSDLLPPTAIIDSIFPSPATQGVDTVHFRGTACDNDQGGQYIVTHEWWSSLTAQVLSTAEDFDMPASALPTGLNSIRFRVWDNEGDSATAWGSVSILPEPYPPEPPADVGCVYDATERRAVLTWTGPLGCTYNVYHDTRAYFTGIEPLATGLAGPPWYHESPDLRLNHFYYVTACNQAGESAPSQRVGLVAYHLNP